MKIKLSKNERWGASFYSGLLALVFGYLAIPIVICILIILLIVAIPLSILAGTFFFITGLVGYTKIENYDKKKSIKANKTETVNVPEENNTTI